MTSSGFPGLAISFTSMWFLHQTGATTYSLVGSLNKIPLSVAGILLFPVPTSLQNFTSILFGLLAELVVRITTALSERLKMVVCTVTHTFECFFKGK
ncbi:hypothetical protein MKW98_013128 [Papaver atlanticum]|uniref:Uncharacterized protein n=1 Tax=Papaver atlanticum TaxID=357466 RepID=A0AAD4XSA6_9MAGN|nr:hypothetical protein MKW98_013128 [Papaver atlanticum]